eukprot:6100502-Pyramimonas_sp.AAC.1
MFGVHVCFKAGTLFGTRPLRRKERDDKGGSERGGRWGEGWRMEKGGNEEGGRATAPFRTQ